MTEEIPAQLAGFRAGSLLAGYRLEGQVGAGGMAVVFRARDERLGRPVALKLLSPGLASGSEFRRRFIAESRAAAAVDDPHIIPVYEAGESGGVLFIAMRFVAGGDLRQVLEREGALPPDRAADVISPVASALDAAHSAGLVHRDVKPGNILVDSRPGRPDHVYLSDFGIVKGAVQGSLTGVGSYLGTPDYMAPEQISGQAVDGRADQYSLACVAFQLLTGVVPFKRDQLPAVIYAHLSVPPPSLVSRRPDLPAAVDGVVAKAMAKTAEKRYESCGDFADALREALGLASYRRRSSATAPRSPRPAVTSPDSQPDMTVDSVPGSTPSGAVVTPEAAPPGVEPASGPGRLEAAAADSAAAVSDLLAPGQPGLPDTGQAGAPARRRRLIPRRRRTGPEPAVVPTDSVPDGQASGPVTPVEAGTAWPTPPAAASIPDAPAAAVADSQLAEEVEAAAASDEPAGEPDRLTASDVVDPAAPAQPRLPDTGPAGAPARRRGPIPRRPRSPRRRRTSPEPAVGTIAAVPDGQPSGPVTPAEPVPAAVRPDEPDLLTAAAETDALPSAQPVLPEPRSAAAVVEPPPAVLPEPRSAAAVVEPPPAVLPEPRSAAALVEAPPAGPTPAGIPPPAEIPPPAARPAEPPTAGTVYPAPGDGLADGGTASLTGPAVAGNGLPAAAATAATDHLPSSTVGTPAVSGDSVGGPDWLTVPGTGAPPGQRPPRRPSPVIVWIRRHRLPVFGLACAILAAAVTLPFISPSQPGSPHASSSSGSPKSSGPSNSAHPSISPTAAATPTFGAALPVQLPADWRSVPITSVAFSPAGDTLAVASARVCLWDVAATHCTSSFGDASVYSVAFSRDGTTLAAGDSSGSIFMWNVLARSQGSTLTDPTGSGVFSVAFSPDGKTLAAGDANGRTYLWNAATGKMIIPLSSPGSKEVTSVAFSPDGAILASASNDHTYLWEVATGKLIGTLTDPGGKVVNSVAFSQDGKILVAGDGNGRTYLWSVATGKLTGTLTVPGSTGVISVACSPDDTTMAAGDLNGKIYIWNVITRKLNTTLTDPNNAEINSVQFSANGKALAIGDLSGSAFIWNISLYSRVAGLTPPRLDRHVVRLRTCSGRNPYVADAGRPGRAEAPRTLGSKLYAHRALADGYPRSRAGGRLLDSDTTVFPRSSDTNFWVVYGVDRLLLRKCASTVSTAPLPPFGGPCERPVRPHPTMRRSELDGAGEAGREIPHHWERSKVRLGNIPWRPAVLLACAALLVGIPASASAAAAAASTGFVALGNLSETPSPVDVYLYSSGSSSPQFVQHGVAYGTILPYQSVSPGDYSVKMRTAGSSATSNPVWSVSLTVKAGGAYMVVPLRTSAQAGQLTVIDNNLTTPSGKSFVRVIQAAIDQNAVTFHCSCAPGAPGNITTNAAPGNVSPQAPIPAGTWTMSATGPTATTSMPVTLTAGTVHTEVVISAPNGGIEILNVTDAAGAGEAPTGGVSTGFGGTAPHGAGSPAPWLALISAGALLVLAGGWRLRRNGPRRLTAS